MKAVFGLIHKLRGMERAFWPKNEAVAPEKLRDLRAVSAGLEARVCAALLLACFWGICFANGWILLLGQLREAGLMIQACLRAVSVVQEKCRRHCGKNGKGIEWCGKRGTLLSIRSFANPWTAWSL
ncbi:MAG TPA: hypothetical protein ENJ82_01465 [Bacteroidetes bacterium]|nr:hypothetical protein [Bacteroidota bacterium]